jgi:hypothetical protein
MRPLTPHSKTLLLLIPAIVFAARSIPAQARGSAGANRADSLSEVAFENAMAVVTSGVWTIDGEYKTPSGAYHKLTGYFAYVAATKQSDDDGDAAVLAMYLEPMAGGASTWLSARLSCAHVAALSTVRCVAEQGASQLLDLNFRFKTIPVRGRETEAEIVEPEDKGEKRWESRSSARGRFTLKRP